MRRIPFFSAMTLTAVIAGGLLGSRGSSSEPQWPPGGGVPVVATAETYVPPMLETSQNERVAKVIDELLESLRMSGSGITIRESCGGEDPCIAGAWCRGVMYLGAPTLNDPDDERLARVMAHEYGHVWSAMHPDRSRILKEIIEPLTDQKPEEALADCFKVVLGYGHAGYWSCDDAGVRDAVRREVGL